MSWREAVLAAALAALIFVLAISLAQCVLDRGLP